MLCLSLSDVAGVLDIGGAIDIADGLYREHAAGAAIPFPPRRLRTSATSLRVTGGALVHSGGIGVRISVAGDGPAVALLFELQTGDPVCLMAYPLSTMRTAGVMGLATRELSNPSAAVLAMIGTGDNASGYVRAACSLRPIERVHVFSRTFEHRERFATQLRAELQLPVVTMTSSHEATAGADIVCVSTSSPDPVLDASQLNRGAFLVSMGRPRELDASVYLAADDVVVSFKPELAFNEEDIGQLSDLHRTGEMSWEKDVHELGAILAGTDSLARGDQRTVVFRDVQAGFGDIALCCAVYRICRMQGRGTEMDLGFM